MTRTLPLLLLLVAGLCRGETLPLAELLDRALDGAALRASDAELDVLDAQRQQREAEAGWQWFASTSAGHYHELTSAPERDEYYGRDLALGLRHPLLGSLRRQLRAVQALEQAREQQGQQRLLARAEQRLALRSGYADWWRAGQEQRWCAGLVDDARRARAALDARRRAGWLRTAQAQGLDDQWQALQRQCGQAVALQDETRADLAQLAGLDIDAGQQAQAEPLAERVKPLTAWRQALEQHPRLQARQGQLRLAEAERQSPWYAGVDSSFALARSYEDRNGAEQLGDGLVVSLSLSAPFDPLDYGRALDREGAARQRAAQARLEAEREQLLGDLGQALRAQRQAAEVLVQARADFAQAAAQLRETRLRRELDAEGQLGQLDAELAHGRAGLQLIAAWHAAWLREAALRLFVEDDQALAGLLGHKPQHWPALSAEAAPGWRQGVYLWDSQRLLQPASGRTELRELRLAGMQRIYLGLTAAQVADMALLRERLQASLAAAHAAGLEVALLLGDPTWLQPGERQGLLELIGQLQGLPFDALHLDLEVEQLGWPVPDSRLQDWLDTLTAVASLNPWPLELSSHPRWFAAPLAGQTCVPCGLPARGVQQVSLMIYTRNAERSAAQIEQIAQRWPALRFRLAQSAEPQLAVDESWAGMPRRQLQQQVERWRARLQPLGVTGVDWQDWTHYPR